MTTVSLSEDQIEAALKLAGDAPADTQSDPVTTLPNGDADSVVELAQAVGLKGFEK